MASPHVGPHGPTINYTERVSTWGAPNALVWYTLFSAPVQRKGYAKLTEKRVGINITKAYGARILALILRTRCQVRALITVRVVWN
ncbi:MAG: hypothetical protein BMS9Abin02_1711 [Anaerolineae bacterium]|nr:MAG: hypothetical protein BMS9Abin02_1711 [Anaerolineae bacterium]